jgi:AAA ATPase domain
MIWANPASFLFPAFSWVLDRMRLTKVRIKNFRSIADVTIELEPTCRILVGINESGKSNVLRAMSLLSADTGTTADDLREFSADEDPEQPAFVLFVFQHDQAERLEAYESVKTKFYGFDDGDHVATIGGTRLTLRQLFVRHSESVHMIDVRTGRRSFTGFGYPTGSEIATDIYKPLPTATVTVARGAEVVPLTSLQLLNLRTHSEVDRLHTVPATPKDVAAIISQAFRDLFMTRMPSCMFWSYSEANLLPPQIALDEFAANPDTCMPLRRMFELAGHTDIAKGIEDAKKRANGVRNLLKRVSDQATAHMHQVWKDYQGLRLQLLPNGAHIDATIQDAYNVYNFGRRSDGFKRFITFLLLVSASVKSKTLENTLYLHDEPDVSLHPSGARYLRDELIKISASNYVVFSTH